MAPNRSTMAGWISATMVLSNANRNVDTKIEMTTRNHAIPLTSRGGFSDSIGSGAFSASVVEALEGGPSGLSKLDGAGLFPLSLGTSTARFFSF